MSVLVLQRSGGISGSGRPSAPRNIFGCGMMSFRMPLHTLRLRPAHGKQACQGRQCICKASGCLCDGSSCDLLAKACSVKGALEA